MSKFHKELNFIVKILKLKPEKNSNLEIDYLREGYVDSLNFIKFIIKIEKHFKIKFNQKDFENRKFRTLKGMISLINKKSKK